AHGWWLIGESKMSKSLGNVVSPLDLIEEYGVDAVRYYLMSEMVLGSDANFTLESFIKRFNSDLANDFGNLLNRVSGLIGKYFEGQVPQHGTHTAEDQAIIDQATRLDGEVTSYIDKLQIHSAIFAILDLVGKANRYMEHEAPWKVAKEDLPRAGTILYVATEALRVAAHHLSPVMPARCATVLDILGARGSGAGWGELTPGTQLQTHEALFPRLEIPKT
ncbi:MAG: class I tRNA ligase family protein, partial [Candidatus Omnitrophica bacterium]|nr:class I tRNA ligase family protein [Candidatus Omnitrophota bacterium]